MCGEQLWSGYWSHRTKGSPPRVRGTGRTPYTASLWRRITPACAGNRGCSFGERCIFGDHPRVCGEQYPGYHQGPGAGGSPPRVRGTAGGCVIYALLPRITPACAGNSLYRMLNPLYVEDHPRVCGEQILGLIALPRYGGSPPRVRGTDSVVSEEKYKRIGSPPRVRGTVHAPFLAKSCSRITPACAGNRLSFLCLAAK